MPRFAVISDIHANLHALCTVMEDALQQQGCTEVVCLGDVVGYNAYPRECLDYIRSLACPVVKGNHDADVSGGDLTRMNPVARRAIEWTREQLDEDACLWLKRLSYQRLERSLFTMVHACLDQPMAWNYIMNANDATASFRKQFNSLCFHGHTHVPRVFVYDGMRAAEDAEAMMTLQEEGEVSLSLADGYKYFINVGSVGQPRDADPRACYVVYDSDNRIVTFRRLTYDVAAAQEAIIAAGLPTPLADRLERGV